MSDVTPKKKKESKKSKRKSNELSPITPGSSEHINGVNGESERKKRKKDKKKKDKKKDRKSQVSSPDNVLSQHETTPVSETTSEQPTIPDVKQIAQTRGQPQAGGSSMFSIISSTSTNATKNSPYQIKSLEGTVAILPTSLSDVPKRIRTLLHSLLLMYDATMGGVLLTLENDVKLLPLGGGLIGGRIMDDLPYVHYRFQVHGMVFCPKVGMKLKGQVIDCTPTFITLTTNHILSTKISTEKLHQQGFFYNTTTLEWTRERDTSSAVRQRSSTGEAEEEDDELGPSTSIYLDDTVEFIVERIRECGGNVMLDGTQPSVSTMD